MRPLSWYDVEGPLATYLFDVIVSGAYDILTLIGIDGSLDMHSAHQLDVAHIQYSRAHFRLLE